MELKKTVVNSSMATAIGVDMDFVIAGLLAVLCTWYLFRPGKKKAAPTIKRQRRHGALRNHKPTDEITN